jgi:hypothetical protein
MLSWMDPQLGSSVVKALGIYLGALRGPEFKSTSSQFFCVYYMYGLHNQ